MDFAWPYQPRARSQRNRLAPPPLKLNRRAVIPAQNTQAHRCDCNDTNRSDDRPSHGRLSRHAKAASVGGRSSGRSARKTINDSVGDERHQGDANELVECSGVVHGNYPVRKPNASLRDRHVAPKIAARDHKQNEDRQHDPVNPTGFSHHRALPFRSAVGSSFRAVPWFATY